MSSKILGEFDEKCELFEDFTDKLGVLISELLRLEEITVHSIEGRDKKRDSLEKKLQKTEKSYNCLEDVTDISGLRVITYFSEDVDKIADIIEREFIIDQENTVDKRNLMESDRFGYLSLHYVVSLTEDRLKHTENRRFKHCKAEIQIRSILQHAWAEIEHDMGYKTELEIPQKIRRRFTRIAGLLELADTEFDSIRNRLSDYKEEVSKRIIEEPTEVLIDKLSLSSFLQEQYLVKDILQQISDRTGTMVIDDYNWSLSTVLSELDYLGINTISELESLLVKNREIVTEWAILWLTPDPEDDKNHYFGSETAIHYLNYVLIAQSQLIQRVIEFLNLSGKGAPNKLEFASEIITTYLALVEKLNSQTK